MCTTILLVSSFALLGVIPVPPRNSRGGKAESCLKVKVIDYWYIFRGPREKKIGNGEYVASISYFNH